jgi:DNA-binding NtrC family response regulator
MQFKRVGGDRTIDADVRIIAATNRNLEREVEESRFRLDLFHRLAVCLVRVPALRDRREDLPGLIRHFAGPGQVLDAELVARLADHPWPGNVRELRNYVERLVLFGESALFHTTPPRKNTSPQTSVEGGRLAQRLEEILTAATSGLPYRQARTLMIETFTDLYVEVMLEKHGTPTLAAKAAGVARRHFHRLKQR